MRLSITAAGLALALLSVPAVAQDAAVPPGAIPSPSSETDPPGALTVTGSVALVSDYRFRGVSRSDEELAVQGGVTLNHQSGLYGGFWASNLSGWGTFGGADLELDLLAGYKFRPSEAATVDVGLTWYMFPGGRNETDTFEPYAKLSGTIGPASLTAGVAYAPPQQALGRYYLNGASAATGVYDDPGDKGSNLYLWGDASSGIPGTPFTVRAHLGYSNGNRGLGPQATSIAPTGEYWDWLLGADFVVPGTPLTLGVAYVDTDISRREAAYLQPSFSKGQDGTGQIADATFIASLTAAF